ncbi:MAG: hypothetical protein ABWY68_02810, partial [Cryobacterium sp.]
MPGTTRAITQSEPSEHRAGLRQHLISVIHGAAVHVQSGYEDHISLTDASALADALLASCGPVKI